MEAAPTPARAGAGAVLDGLLSDMRATRAFEAVRLPALTHLAAWGLDKGTCVAYGPLEVEAMQVSPRARPRGTRHAARGTRRVRVMQPTPAGMGVVAYFTKRCVLYVSLRSQ